VQPALEFNWTHIKALIGRLHISTTSGKYSSDKRLCGEQTLMEFVKDSFHLAHGANGNW
jgi:hypothetical protein